MGWYVMSMLDCRPRSLQVLTYLGDVSGADLIRRAYDDGLPMMETGVGDYVHSTLSWPCPLTILIYSLTPTERTSYVSIALRLIMVSQLFHAGRECSLRPLTPVRSSPGPFKLIFRQDSLHIHLVPNWP